MNPNVARWLPPGLVVATALWCGWPKNNSLFEDIPVASAKAASWKASDLQVTQVLPPTADPFLPVLQPISQAVPTEVVQETQKTGPRAPTSAELLAYIQLDGFGRAGGQQWAIINGRPRRPGDVVMKQGHFAWPCRLIEIADDHVVLQCGPTSVDAVAMRRSTRTPAVRTETEASSQPTADKPESPPQIPRPQEHNRTSGVAS